MVLVDSSVYIELLRGRRNPARELAEAFASIELVGCSVVRCEVLRGMVDPLAKAKLASFFDLLVDIPTDQKVWAATENLAWQLDRAGKVLPLADLIIAVCALQAGATLLTNDKHFALIPRLRLASW